MSGVSMRAHRRADGVRPTWLQELHSRRITVKSGGPPVGFPLPEARLILSSRVRGGDAPAARGVRPSFPAGPQPRTPRAERNHGPRHRDGGCAETTLQPSTLGPPRRTAVSFDLKGSLPPGLLGASTVRTRRPGSPEGRALTQPARAGSCGCRRRICLTAAAVPVWDSGLRAKRGPVGAYRRSPFLHDLPHQPDDRDPAREHYPSDQGLHSNTTHRSPARIP